MRYSVRLKGFNHTASYTVRVSVMLLLILSVIACSSSPRSEPIKRPQSPNKNPAPEKVIQPSKATNGSSDEANENLTILDEGEDVNAQPTNGERSTGVVKWFNPDKGYGFIVPDGGGKDLHVHFSQIRGEGYRTLKEGQKVEFAVGEGATGPTAFDVVVLGAPTSDGDTNDQETASERSTGVVKWFNPAKGYGFIVPDGGGKDLHVHFSQIRGEGYRTLEEGQKVEFAVGESATGPTAFDVVVID